MGAFEESFVRDTNIVAKISSSEVFLTSSTPACVNKQAYLSLHQPPSVNKQN